jgi:predicted amidohydrolase
MRIAVLQMASKAGDVTANLARIDRVMAEAAVQGADLLIAPELAVPGYGAGAAMHGLAERIDGAQADALAEMSRRHGPALVAGFAERAGDSVHISALFTDGTRRTAYRKAQLYGPYERDLFVPGPLDQPLIAFRGWLMGILICYDAEFPERVRHLARAGADLIVVPTALPDAPGSPFIATKMMATRAFENQVFLAYADQCGRDESFAYSGLSHIVAPDGGSLALAGPQDEALLIADLDPDAYAASRAINTYLADLRT